MKTKKASYGAIFNPPDRQTDQLDLRNQYLSF